MCVCGYMNIRVCVCMFLKVLFIWVTVCGEYSVKWNTGITSPLTSCNPPRPLSLLQSISSTKHHKCGCGMYVSVAKTFHCIFRQKTKDVLLGPVFGVSISYSNHTPICPSLWFPPVPSHRKWGIRITRGGYEKGHLFHCCRWQSSRRNNRVQERVWK